MTTLGVRGNCPISHLSKDDFIKETVFLCLLKKEETNLGFFMKNLKEIEIVYFNDISTK